MTANDQDLLRQFSRDHSQDAFTALVQRHVNLVYSTALRHVRSRELAEEVAQSVFSDLARNAARLKAKTVLSAWLYQVTRGQAVDVVRRESRRQARERFAAEMTAVNAAPSDWTRIELLLDDAMESLNETDRAAVLLRYFENKPLREVGALLGASDDAAQKRVSRAVERLREFFSKHGVTASASGLVVLLSANAIQAAPAGLVAAIATTAAALAGTIVPTTTTATAIKTIVMTTLQKTIIGATLAAAVGAGIYEARHNSKLRDQNESLQQQTAQLKTESESLSNRLTAVGNTQSPSAKSLPDEQYNELLRLRGMAGMARRAIGEAEQLRAQLARQASEATNNLITGAVADAAKQAAEQQMEGRLSRMAASLHLTAEQAQAARDILMREVRMKSAVIQQGQSGKLDMKEIMRQAMEAGDPDEQIKALLTPDQRAAFPAYRQEEAAHNASLTANQELLNMQSTLGLTAEQTDRVYAALYEVSFNQLTGRTQPPSTNPRALDDPLAAQAEAMQWTLNQKTKALESVLTPTQLENYRQQQALQAKLEKEIMNKMQGAGGPK
jgi:RNA polymerase sigma factor (sigma-70 family)